MEALKAVALAPVNWISANFFGEEIPRIFIDIKFKHFQKIQKIREEALADKQLTQGSDDYVPASIRHGNRSIKVKLRLKGDGIDHLLGDKWSFRIHVKGKNHLFNMRRFSIHSPGARSFEGEILFFQALRREGILAPRYFFIQVTVNGKDIGLMALEEHFSKELLESQGRRESVILKFNEYLLHEELNGSNGFSPLLANYRNVDIQPFRASKVLRSETLSSDLKTARGLLRAFIDKSLPASEVFDLDLMGRFIAIADLWGAWHTLQWHNVRLYYNPITTRLEPIGFDATIKEGRVAFPSGYKFASDILSDPKFFKIYRDIISRLVLEMNDGTFLDWAKPLQKKQLKILHREFPFLPGFNLEELIHRSLSREREIKGNGQKYETILKAYSTTKNGQPQLELFNPLPEPVLISSIKLVDNVTKNIFEFSAQQSIEYPIQLNPTLIGDLPKSNILSYQKPTETQNYSIEIKAKVLHQTTARTIESIHYHTPLENDTIPKVSLNKFIEKHSFLVLENNTQEILVKPGIWDVSEWLVIPENMVLKIPEGTELRFASSAGLIARGPVMISGTEKAPVILTGIEEGDLRNGWQGIIVMKTDQPSLWSYVTIMDTNGISHNGWNLSGGVNFYEADIKMKHVTLIGNRSEDALNIVRSNFTLDSVTIKDTASDAFDSDFSKGTVQGGYFENIGHAKGGGDGIDVSGSEITVIGTSFKNISDKALSVGEKSTMIASDIYIEQVGTGAASKDGSHLTLTNVKIQSARIAGLMAYVKKLEYGPGTIIASHLETESVPHRAVVQKGSKITIDDSDVKATDLDVKELYATLMKSGIK